MEERCRACGTILEDGSIFCHHCGSRTADNEVPLTAEPEKHAADSIATPISFDPGPAASSQPVDVNELTAPSAVGTTKKTGSGSRVRMVIVTAVAVILITIAGFFGIEQDPRQQPADSLSGIITKAPDKSSDQKKKVPTASSAKTGSPTQTGKPSKPNPPPPAPLTSADISALKQAVIKSHGEYMNALTSKSPSTDLKREAFKAAVAKLDSGLQSYYVAGKRGTSETARKELNGLLTALSSAKPPEVKTGTFTPAAPVSKTAVVKPAAQVKKPSVVTAPKPLKTTTASKVAAKTTQTDGTKTAAKKIMNIDQIFYQKQLASGAYQDYMNSARYNDPSITKKRAVFKSSVARLGHSLYVYYVTDKRGTLEQARQEMRLFLIGLEGTASPAMIADINQGVSTVK